ALGDDAEGAVGLAAGGGEDAIGDLALDGDGHGVAPGVVDEEREKQGRSSAIGEVADEAERAAGDRLDDGGRQFALASEAVAFDEGEAGGGLNGPYGSDGSGFVGLVGRGGQRAVLVPLREQRLAQELSQAAVEFAGDDGGAGFEEGFGEGSGAGADFEDDVAGAGPPYAGRLDELAQQVVV